MERNEKTAIVTGGAQGIGKAIARMFLAGGVRVFIVDIDAEAGRETEEEYRALGNIAFFRADVSKEEEVAEFIRRAVADAGRLDILVNNAGIAVAGNAPLAGLALDDWNRVLSVNLTGPFLCAKHAAPHLEKTNGTIVMIASTRAFMSEPHTEAYSASKGGVVALTHALANSLGPKVRVNCISPGWIEVSDWKKKSLRREPEHSAADLRQHPAGRVGVPDDVAAMAAYLASDAASFITGANFIVDGGMTRKMIYA